VDVTPQPAPRPARRGMAFLAPAFVVLAVVLTVAGAFLPLFRTTEPFGYGEPGIIRSVRGAWRIAYTFPGRDEVSSPSAPIGIPLLLAGAILLAAAALGIGQAVTRRLGPVVSRTTLVGAAFLLGAVCTVGMLGAPPLSGSGRSRVEISAAIGMWLLVAAALAAAVAAVLSLRVPAAGRADWADPDVAYADTTTPPSGVAITVLPPERD
jgi:hypothetical protein